jgi:hypothetical protein
MAFSGIPRESDLKVKLSLSRLCSMKYMNVTPIPAPFQKSFQGMSGVSVKSSPVMYRVTGVEYCKETQFGSA